MTVYAALLVEARQRSATTKRDNEARQRSATTKRDNEARQRSATTKRVGAEIFFADEAHFRADADLRGKWVLKGEPALVDSTSPRWGEKASYDAAVCLETGEVETMELQGYSNAETSTALQARAEELLRGAQASFYFAIHVDPTLALV